jgi:hypothetical protein
MDGDRVGLPGAALTSLPGIAMNAAPRPETAYGLTEARAGVAQW